jgi:hypothetical protein
MLRHVNVRQKRFYLYSLAIKQSIHFITMPLAAGLKEAGGKICKSNDF